MADLDVWCRITVCRAGGEEVGSWELSGSGPPDLAVLDGVARLILVASRAGGSVVVHDLSAPMAELVELVGLCREVGGQPERREDGFGVEEGVELGDPPA